MNSDLDQQLKSHIALILISNIVPIRMKLV